MIGFEGNGKRFSGIEGILETFCPPSMLAFVLSRGLLSEALALATRKVAMDPIVFDFGSGGGRGCIRLC